jgi:hypothetical protein
VKKERTQVVAGPVKAWVEAHRAPELGQRVAQVAAALGGGAQAGQVLQHQAPIVVGLGDGGADALSVGRQVAHRRTALACRLPSPGDSPLPCKTAQAHIVQPSDRNQQAHHESLPACRTCGLSACAANDWEYLSAAAVRHSYASSGCCARTRRATSVSATAQLSAGQTAWPRSS